MDYRSTKISNKLNTIIERLASMKKMRNHLIRLFILLIFLSSCSFFNDESDQEPIEKDLSEIKKDGVLKVLVTYSSTSYFLYRGQPMGYEYELLKRLSKHLNLKLDIVITKDINKQFNVLNKGEVDLIAHGVTITNNRKEKVSFTDYLYLVKQVLVQKKPNNWRNISWANLQKEIIHDPIQLIGDTVSVRKNSSYFERIQNLSDEIGGDIAIDTLSGNLTTDEIIKMVVDGKIKYTVADDNIAKINASYYPILNIDVPISFSQRVAWVVRKNSPELLNEINEWVKYERKKSEYYVIYNKYFKSKRDYKRRNDSEYYSLNENKISKYDEIIIEHAEKIGWDWRLVASQIYQESRFQPESKSWAGAEGLMQIMPATASELGVNDVNNPHESIAGGTDYLNMLYDNFSDIQDSLIRIKFTLAAYNCGYQHIRDAQRLAEENDLDKTLWYDNVEKMLLELSKPRNYNKPFIKYGYVRGVEPVNYVKQIFYRYKHYQKFIAK